MTGTGAVREAAGDGSQLPSRTAVGQPGRRTGVAAGLAGLLLAGACAAGDTPASSCRLEVLAELPVELTTARAVIQVRIDDKPVRLALDTGAFVTSLTTAAAQRLHLETFDTKTTVLGVGWVRRAREAKVRLQLPGQPPQDATLAVLDQKLDVDGLLGASWLLHNPADLDLDLPAGKVRLVRPKGCKPEEVVYWGKAYAMVPMQRLLDTHEVRVEIRANGKPLLAVLDSGAPITVLTPGAAAKAGIRAEPLPADGRASDARRVGVVDDFTLDTETIHKGRVEIAELFGDDDLPTTASHIPVHPEDVPEMLLGLDFLRAHHVYAAKGQRRLYFSYISGKVFPGPPAPAPAAAGR